MNIVDPVWLQIAITGLVSMTLMILGPFLIFKEWHPGRWAHYGRRTLAVGITVLGFLSAIVFSGAALVTKWERGCVPVLVEECVPRAPQTVDEIILHVNNVPAR